MKYTLLFLTGLLTLSCGTSSDATHTRHEFASKRIAEERNRPLVSRQMAAPVDEGQIATSRRAALQKFSRTEEVKGILTLPADPFIKTYDSGSLPHEKPLALDELLWVAYRTSPAIAASRRRLLASFESYDQVRFLDDIVSRYRGFTSTTPPPSTGAPAARGSRKAPAMKAPHPSMDALRGDLADLQVAVAWEMLTATITGHVRQLTTMASEWAYTMALIKAVDEHIILVKRLVSVVEVQLASGRSRQADLLVIQGEWEALKTKRANLERKRAAQVAALNLELGRPATAPLEIQMIPTATSTPVVTELVTTIRANDPMTRRLKLQVSRAGVALRLAETMALSSLHQSAADTRLGQLGSAGVARSKMLVQPKARVPSRSRGNGPTQALLNAMRQKLRSRQSEVQARLIDVGAKTSLAHSAQQNALAQLDTRNRQIIPLARSAVKSIEQSYAARKAGFLDMHRAASRLIQATTDAATSRRDALIATAKLRALLARSSGELK